MPTSLAPSNRPLTEAELDRLTDFLEHRGGETMNIEELDGFFAALIAGPDLIAPSEYMPLVLPDPPDDSTAFEGIEEANEILGLIMRHWNGIAATLRKGDVYLPLLLEDDTGVAHANDWARGFIRGTDMRTRSWARLVNDEEYGGCMLPALMLYHEHDNDPELRPPPIEAEKRQKIILHMTAGIVQAYRYFQSHPATPPGRTLMPGAPKIGRNDPCPCGSGKKYKRCCSGQSPH